MLGLIIAAVTLGAGYVYTRRFVRERLRFVDAVRRPAAPLLVGAATAIVAVPVVALLPIVGVGAGVAAGRRDHATE